MGFADNLNAIFVPGTRLPYLGLEEFSLTRHVLNTSTRSYYSTGSEQLEARMPSNN